MTDRPGSPGSMDSDAESAERMYEAFEAAWNTGTPPRIEDFLASTIDATPAASAQHLLGELVMIDLEYRWRKAGATDISQADTPDVLPRRPKLEAYVERYAALGPIGQVPAEWIAHEYFVRHRWGDRPSHAEYLARFAEMACRIEEVLTETDRRLASTPAPVRDPEATADYEPPSSWRELPDTVAYVPADGERAGRYRFLRDHAQGGLGRVSLAMDEELHREVALKELLDFLAHDQHCRTRFVREAEITGSLEHPGVVPVYGFGRYSDGRPFYAMRFIRGQSLKEAIAEFHRDRKSGSSGAVRLAFRQLLGRFVAVCQVIHYAHSRGVVHRDLKPANVMLGKYGETLVVDWGLAKPLGKTSGSAAGQPAVSPSADAHVDATRLGSVLGTPSYMSPEQAAGLADEIGPASDVYGLGAILYCILTSRPPVEASGSEDCLTRVKRGDFPSPRQVDSRLPGALSAVAMKAMARQPAGRYASAAALAEDVEHWLADEPVAAYPEAAWAKAARWMRRHRSWTVAGVASLAVVTFVSLTAAMLINQARREAERLSIQNATLAKQEHAAREEATRRFRETREAIDTWLTGTSEVLRYYPGVQEARKRMLQKAADDYERFSRERSSDVDVEMERCRTAVRLGDVRSLLGESANAEQAYRSSIDSYARLTRENPDRLDCYIELAGSRTKLGLAMAAVDRHQEAEQCYRTALQELDALPANHAGNAALQDARGSVLLNLGVLRARIGKHDEALRLLRQAAETFKGLLDTGRKDPRCGLALATARDFLGQLLAEEGRFDEAGRLLAEAVESLDRLVAAEPSHPKYLQSRAAANIRRAGVLRQTGQYGAELASYHAAEADYEELCKAIPDVLDYREQLALTWTDLAQLLHDRDENARADQTARRAMDALSVLCARFPQVPRYREEWAACRDVLGQALFDLDRAADAREHQEAALQACRLLSQDNPDVPQYVQRRAVVQSHLARSLFKLGDHDAAQRNFREAIADCEKLTRDAPGIPAYRDDAAFIHEHLGTMFVALGKTEEAEEELQRAIDIRRALCREHKAAEYQWRLAATLVLCPVPRLCDSAEAIELARQAVQQSPRNAVFAATLGAASYRAGDWKSSLDSLREASVMDRAGVGRYRFFAAMARHRLGKSDEAVSTLEEALAWRAQNCPGSPDLKRLEAEAVQLIRRPNEQGGPQ